MVFARASLARFFISLRYYGAFAATFTALRTQRIFDVQPSSLKEYIGFVQKLFCGSHFFEAKQRENLISQSEW